MYPSASTALLDYLEEAEDIGDIDRLIHAIVSDRDVQRSDTLRKSVETFAVLLAAEIEV